MPVSHIGLTVSHLPTSCSFFLSALQPLGYRYIGQQGNQIGLGIYDADFFLCQETPGVKAGAAHIAFTAHSRAAVRDFYAAALTAGGRPNGAPASRSDEDGHFNAAILDLDGNSIEVVFRNGPDFRDDGTVIEHSRVITWRRTVTESFRDDRSVVSSRSTQSLSKQASAPAAPSVAPSAASKAPSVARSVSEPAIPQAPAAPESGNGGGAAKQIIGTLLGAAAGAAVAYAMVASERDSAKKEKDFEAFKTAKAAMASVAQFAQGSGQPKLPQQDPQPAYETKQLPPPVHRNISDSDSQYSSPRARSIRAIEAAPSDHGPLYTKAPTQISVSRQLEYAPAQSIAPSRVSEYVPAASVAPSKAASRSPEPRAIEYVQAASIAPSKAPSRAAELRAIEYAPAASVAPSRLSHRSKTSPELATAEKARSTVSRAQSAAPSSFISTFVPDEFERRNTDGGSVASHRSSKSKKSSHSKHRSSSRSRAHSPSPSKAPSDAPSKAHSKVGSVLGSILGRGGDDKSIVSNPFRDEYEIDDYTDDDDDYTIAPSDSISQVSSSHSRRKHRSHRSSRDKDEHSVAGSSASKHSRSSKHSSKSHKSRSSHSSHYHTADEEFRNSVISEPSDASTIKPKKSRHPERKDSATDYDEMFDRVQYGSGNVPVRGITPSMVQGGSPEEGKSKSVMGYKMAQRLRAFEGR
ncbi:hypothetical protein DPSP01_013182 [Paraphaeosphaeria sporulosa]|uniref:VOC domain-containing protein n=1 Tax=Paraphaeosphaeria sporulosa TaxID=1460663 RepID=A0A177BYS1_9PLEO|nr:uncharacterized protein CC84DRAFT_1264054 [Paraphaeosphaeria sporulosa]OAF99677.1 hypothetical protein CC84DRAFT_1264054 [Paraphaeosphaeria sporulosa]